MFRGPSALLARVVNMENNPSRESRCTAPRALLTGKAVFERRVHRDSYTLARSMRQSVLMYMSWIKFCWWTRSSKPWGGGGVGGGGDGYYPYTTHTHTVCPQQHPFTIHTSRNQQNSTLSLLHTHSLSFLLSHSHSRTYTHIHQNTHTKTQHKKTQTKNQQHTSSAASCRSPSPPLPLPSAIRNNATPTSASSCSNKCFPRRAYSSTVI